LHGIAHQVGQAAVLTQPASLSADVASHLALDDAQSRLEVHGGQAALANDASQGPLSFVGTPSQAGHLGVALGQVLGQLPHERHGALPGNQTLNVSVVGLVQGARHGPRQDAILEEGIPGGAVGVCEAVDDGGSAGGGGAKATVLGFLGGRLETLVGAVAASAAVRGKAGEAREGLVAGGDAGGAAAAGLGMEAARLAGADGAAVGADGRGAVLRDGALEAQRSLVVVRRDGGHRAPRERRGERLYVVVFSC